MLDPRVAKLKLIPACSLIGYTSYLEGGPLYPARKKFFNLTYQAWSVKTAENLPISSHNNANVWIGDAKWRNEISRSHMYCVKLAIALIFFFWVRTWRKWRFPKPEFWESQMTSRWNWRSLVPAIYPWFGREINQSRLHHLWEILSLWRLIKTNCF